MYIRALTEKSIVPTETLLEQELGASIMLLRQILDFLKINYGDIVQEWKHYGKSSGWTLKLLYKKRNIMFVAPLKGNFWVVFTFGEKAVEKVLNSELSEEIKDSLLAAQKYAEGRSIKLDAITTGIEAIKELVKIKLAN